MLPDGALLRSTFVTILLGAVRGRGSSTRQHRARRGCPKQTAAMGTADPPAAVVQRLQEEHLRKDVIGYGSLGEALAAQGGRAEGGIESL